MTQRCLSPRLFLQSETPSSRSRLAPPGCLLSGGYHKQHHWWGWSPSAEWSCSDQCCPEYIVAVENIIQTESDHIISTFYLQLHILASILLLFTCNIRLQTDEAVWPGPVMPSVQCVPATWVQHLKLWESLPPVTKARTCS